jgi:DNA (cytosine-5)-methyltransferase 1
VRRFTVISLFSGAGGLDLGFVQSGLFSIIFANDILLSAMQTYSRNLGLKLSACNSRKSEAQVGIALTCGIEHVNFEPLKNGEADVIIGGPPCQDFSIVRGPEWDRRGVEVKRGRLYAHFVRALAVLQPKAFLFENVPGLVSANKGLAYKIILEDFSHLNLRWDDVRKVIGASDFSKPAESYEIIFSNIMDFSQFGVPQKRKRLVIVGIRRDLVKSEDRARKIKSIFLKILNNSEGLFTKYPLTPIETFEGRRLDELNEVYREIVKKWDGVWLEVNTEEAMRWKTKIWDKLTFNILNDYLIANDIKLSSKEELEEAINQHEEVLKELGYYRVPILSLKPADGTNEIPSEDPAVVERMKRIPFDENHEFTRGTKWEVEGRNISLVYRRLHPLKPAYTVVAYGGGGTHGYHYDRSRTTLTLRERARLQTFPDTFLFSGSKTQIRAQIGEAVPPLATKRFAHALAEVLSELEE